MAMRTKEQYVDSVRRQAPELYSFGERVSDIGSHPCFKPPLDAIGLVYELSSRQDCEGLLTAQSPFTGGKVSRFVHILSDREDLDRRFRASRYLVHKHGACIGAGMDLITACDIRVASADAKFSVRETKIAMVADVGTLQRLPRVIGDGPARELIFTGRDIDAARALAIGLLNDVLPDPDAVHAHARQLAHEIAANSPLAVQGAKQVLGFACRREVDAALDYVALWNSAFLHSEDLTEAMTAFMQRRPPNFRGQ